MTTLFLALQCVQCSTMQVKQQKKSSNKWVCAVCNQRQSVLRVHARGYRAADLRRYVQGANLSRGRGAPAPEVDWGPAAAGEQRDEVPRERRRMDWSEYLDDPGECDGGGSFAGARDGGIVIEVTTELPQESPKVTSLKRLPKAQLGIAGKRPNSPINPTSSKSQRIESPCSATATAEAQKSKWSKYLDASFFEEKSELEGFGQHRTELDECVTTEVVVDDEATMGKSPAKWVKSVLFGKKSTKSNSIKANDLLKAASNNEYSTGKEPAFSENSPVISEPVLVSSHNNGTVSAIGKAENSNLPNGAGAETMGRGVENQNIVGSNTPNSPEKLREELAAVKAQAAFRGYLARRAFCALKGIIRLQALIRGHLVRRQAVSTLRATLLIVKFQALVRGRNVRLSSTAMRFIVKFGQHKFGGAQSSDAWKEKVSSNAYVRKLLSSPIVVEALHFQYDEKDPNSAYNWLERWTISCIWKPVSQPKIVADGKPQVRKASYAMETASAKLKRNVRKCSAVTVESFQTNMTVEPEKPKRNRRKFSSFPDDSVPDSQLSELEKVKRNLRKVTNSMAEASKISNSMTEDSKVSNTMADVSKVSNSMAEASKITSLVNGISDHQDNQCEKALQSAREASFLIPPDTQESDSSNLLESSNIDNLIPDLKSDLETPFNCVLTGEKVNEPTAIAQAVEVMPLQNIDNEDNVLGKKEEPRSKEELQSNGSLRTSKRSSFPTKSEYPENGTQNTPVPPRQPSYMAATESAKAKLRAQNSPRLDSDSSADRNGFTRRQSLPSATNNRAIKVEWRR